MKHTFYTFGVLMAIGVGLGCERPPSEDSPNAPVPNKTANTPSGGEGGGVTPISPAAGGLSPVTGAESVQGAGGGGVQQAAKERAKRVGSSAPSSLNQMGGSE